MITWISAESDIFRVAVVFKEAYSWASREQNCSEASV